MSNQPADPPSGQSIQDLFLNSARRQQLAVTIQLMAGMCLDVRIKSFDRFAIVVVNGGSDHLIFKHAIALIRSAGAIRPNAATT